MTDFPGNVNAISRAEVLGSHIDPAKQPAPPEKKTAPSKADTELNKLKAFLMENFRNETGDETPVDCAIRLLGKAKKK
jgi:hypothetical protein